MITSHIAFKGCHVIRAKRIIPAVHFLDPSTLIYNDASTVSSHSLRAILSCMYSWCHAFSQPFSQISYDDTPFVITSLRPDPKLFPKLASSTMSWKVTNSSSFVAFFVYFLIVMSMTRKCYFLVWESCQMEILTGNERKHGQRIWIYSQNYFSVVF